MRALVTVAMLSALTLCGADEDKNKNKPMSKVSANDTQARGTERITRQVRHELVMLPFYGVFDFFSYKVDGSTVTLLGEVTRPTLKSSAENVVKNIEGVERVDNQIEVLPLSPADDRIRLATYQAIYGHASLNRYALRAVPPIHIIVNQGQVTLKGAVGNEGDKNIAYLQATSVPGAFSVKNELIVDQQ